MSNNVVELINKVEERFLSIASSNMKFDAEKGFAIQILNNNSFLAKVANEDNASLLQAVTNVAAINLSLNPAEKQAYLISRSVKVGQNKWKSKIFLEPSYMGLCKLATDSGSIKWAQSNCVYKNDTFTDNGVGMRPTHIFEAFASLESRGEFVGVYAVAKTSEGDYLTTIMNAEQVHSIRNRSEAWKKSQSGPWKTDFTQMAKKAVIRQAFKMWPRTNLHSMAQAVELSNENEGFEPIVTAPEFSQYTATQKEYFDQLIVKSDALGMYVFEKTLSDESIFTNLYHSFEKGTKGKYQAFVNKLCSTGRDSFLDYVAIFEDANTEQDALTVTGNIADLTSDAVELIKLELSHDALLFLNESENTK